MPRREGGVALCVVLCLLAGCDFFGLGTAGPPSPDYEVMSTLGDRTEVLRGAFSAPSASGAPGATVSLTPVVQVRPPTVKNTQAQAGHVSYDPETERLHVAYKLSGASFGGGIDVLDVRPGTTAAALVEGRRSLHSSNVDIVAVRSDAGAEALYAAGAVTTKKRRRSPAVVSKIVPGDTTVQAQTSKRLSHNVAKSVVLGTDPEAVYVPTDENDLYRLGPDLETTTKQTAGGAAGFRSAVAQDGQIFVLDRSGRLLRTSAGDFQALSSVGTLTDGPFGNGTVARLHADADRLYAALNEQGFALVAPTGAPMWTSGGASVSDESRYTCVSTGPDYLYAGRFDGVIEVYRRPDTIPEQDLERVGTFGPWGGTYGADLSGAPINHIEVVGDHLYAASSRDGLVVVRVNKE